MTDYCKETEACCWLWLAGTTTTANPLPHHSPLFHIKHLNALIRCTYYHFLWRLNVGINLNKRFPKHDVLCRSCSEWKIIINNSWMFSKHLKVLETHVDVHEKGSGFTKALYWSSFVTQLWKPALVLSASLYLCFILLCNVYLFPELHCGSEELLTMYWLNLKSYKKNTLSKHSLWMANYPPFAFCTLISSKSNVET